MGGSKPPPKVDRSRERQAWVDAQNEARRRQAAEYNTQVNTWNQGLQDRLSRAAALRSRASGMTILDDEFFRDVDTTIGSLRGDINNYNWSLQAPRWESSVNSGISDDFSSGLVTLEVPSLASANVDGRQTGLSDLQSALDALTQLRNQRTAEEDRVRAAINQGRGSQAALRNRLNTMSLRDYRTNRDSLATELTDLRGQIGGFSSRLFEDNFMNQDFANLRAGLDQLSTRKNELATNLTNEENRIRDFQRQLQQDMLSERGDISGRTIADLQGIDQDSNDLTNLRRRIAGFSSVLDPDFNPAMTELQALEGQIGNLRGQRTAEEQRIQAFRSDLLANANQLRSGLGGANIYDLNAINQLRTGRDAISSRISGFSSLLNPQFNDVNAILTEAGTGIDNLIGQRNTALQTLLTNAGRSIEGLADVPLQNEAEIRNRLTQLERFNTELGAFSGNDLTDERAAITGFQNQLQDRLGQLNTRRSDIETRARSLLAQLQNGSFTELSQLDPLEAQRAQLATEQELFAALQALDELDSIRSRITSERARIERDIANRRTAREGEQAAIQSMQSSTQGGLSGIGLTEDQIRQLLMGISTNRRNELQLPGAQAALN